MSESADCIVRGTEAVELVTSLLMASKCLSSVVRWSSIRLVSRKKSLSFASTHDAGKIFLPRQPRALWSRGMSTSKKRKVYVALSVLV